MNQVMQLKRLNGKFNRMVKNPQWFSHALMVKTIIQIFALEKKLELEKNMDTDKKDQQIRRYCHAAYKRPELEGVLWQWEDCFGQDGLEQSAILGEFEIPKGSKLTQEMIDEIVIPAAQFGASPKLARELQLMKLPEYQEWLEVAWKKWLQKAKAILGELSEETVIEFLNRKNEDGSLDFNPNKVVKEIIKNYGEDAVRRAIEGTEWEEWFDFDSAPTVEHTTPVVPTITPTITAPTITPEFDGESIINELSAEENSNIELFNLEVYSSRHAIIVRAHHSYKLPEKTAKTLAELKSAIASMIEEVQKAIAEKEAKIASEKARQEKYRQACEKAGYTVVWDDRRVRYEVSAMVSYKQGRKIAYMPNPSCEWVCHEKQLVTTASGKPKPMLLKR